MVKHCGLDQIRVDHIRTQERGRVFIVWNQQELNKWAGCRDAKPMTETVQAIFDGEVYGYWIKDSNGDDLESSEHDSCWGFIGDSDYCLGEARQAVDSILAFRRKARLQSLATWIRNRVPLLKRQELLAALPPIDSHA
jgi:hypothetical protein